VAKDHVMVISPMAAGEYFRGLLLLSRKDHKITEAETALLKRIGKSFGFEREFCDHTIRDILENEHVLETPPEFSTTELAARFIKDGLTLALSDKEFTAFEAEWLKATVEKNGLAVEWFIQQWKDATNRQEANARLEVDELFVKYY
jgi:hypothetical protein